MSRFIRQIGDLMPRTGRLITESGQHWNEADRGKFVERYDIIHQTIANGAIRWSRVALGIDQDVYYIGFRVPEGRRLVIFSYFTNLTENKYTLTAERRPDGFELNTGALELYKNKLCELGSDTVQSQAWLDVNPLGDGEVLQESIVDSGNNPGAARPANVTLLDDVFLCFSTDRVIKINRQDAGSPYDLGIMLVAWEEEINA